MANFARRSNPQKPKVINAPIVDKTFRKRDGSEGVCGVFSFRDGSKAYTIQITKDGAGRVTRRGREITGWAQIAQFVDNGRGGNGGW